MNTISTADQRTILTRLAERILAYDPAVISERGLYLSRLAITDTIGVTLLEPILATLPKRLQRLRIGPFASPEKYSARDFVITNWLCIWTGLVVGNLPGI